MSCMREYYCITQLTGTGYELLLDAVDSTMLACFYNGTIVCVGSNPVLNDIVAISELDTKVAA